MFCLWDRTDLPGSFFLGKSSRCSASSGPGQSCCRKREELASRACFRIQGRGEEEHIGRKCGLYLVFTVCRVLCSAPSTLSGLTGSGLLQPHLQPAEELAGSLAFPHKGAGPIHEGATSQSLYPQGRPHWGLDFSYGSGQHKHAAHNTTLKRNTRQTKIEGQPTKYLTVLLESAQVANLREA